MATENARLTNWSTRLRFQAINGLVALLVALPAAAIVYVIPTDENMVDQSPIIVFGEVLSVQPGSDGQFPTTDYLFAVEEVLKGFVAGNGIMVRQPGGVAADGTVMSVMGLPMLGEGDRVLLFLRAEESRAYPIVEYALGMFWEVDVGGQSLLLREPSLQAGTAISGATSALSEASRGHLPRDAARFRRWISDRAVGIERAADYVERDLADGPMAVQSPYRLIRTPANCLHDLMPVRWQEFDLGNSLRMTTHSGGQVGVPGGGAAELRAAMGAWNNDTESHVRLATAGTATPTEESTQFGSERYWVLYEDPFDSIHGAFDPERGGTLAITLTYYSCGGQVPVHSTLGDAPVQALQITYTQLITQDGYGEGWLATNDNPRKAHEEIMAHELGHVLGIGHSCGFGVYPCPDAGAVPEAIMRAYPHADGRGARLNSDDLAALRYLYPMSSGTGAGPDLVVESPRSTESSVALGGTFRFGATVHNRGEGPSEATTLRYYRSADRTITTSDTPVGTDPIGTLSPSDTDRQSIGQRAPSSDGTYYYGACVDSVPGESDTTNNCSSGVRVTVGDGGTSGSDLVVESPRSTESSVAPGGTFRFGATVRNQGEGPSEATILRYYRSTDSTITTSDTPVGTDPIGALAVSDTDRQSIGQRAPSTDGTYYYGACVDPVAGESDTMNNCSSGVLVTVGEGGGGVSGADLVVESPRSTESSVAPRGTFRFGATVRNQGVGSSEATTLRYYRSTDSTITRSDTPVGTDPIGALSVSDTDRQSVGQRAPSSDGTYYYGACVDPVAGESDTTNNCSSGVRVTVGDIGGTSAPDLVVQSPSVSDSSLTTGQSFTLRATVLNHGDDRSSSTVLRYYRSSDSTISTSDTQVGTDSVGALSASGTSAESISLTAPSTVGTYYYGACVDSVSGESATNNNCSEAVRVTVTASGGGDDAITGELTSCSASRRGSFIDVTMRGTLRANRRVTNVFVTGYANGYLMGTDSTSSIAAGSSWNFRISGSFFFPGATTVSCRAEWRASVPSGTSGSGWTAVESPVLPDPKE